MLKVIPRSVSQAQRDIRDWRNALRVAQRASDPRFYLLHDLYDNIAIDALLSAQVSNRHDPTIAATFELVDAQGQPNAEATAALASLPVVEDIVQQILLSELYGCSLVELSTHGKTLTVTPLPRQNVDPVGGRFFPDAGGQAYVCYRQLREYGSYVLEFNSGHLGLLNRAVPHVLMKRFAQSCWSELCEIYGIPPRYVKTNTTDPAMLNRAETMLRDMGAAAAFVIDSSEEFQFANATSTNGDVYNNLIALCNSELSLLISGAIIGQDTQHGNYSKEQASIGVLQRLIQADQRLVERYMNSTVLPALISIGWLPRATLSFRYSAPDDPQLLWERVKDLLPYKEVDNEWLTQRFGIPVSDRLPAAPGGEPQLAADSFFV